jgi:hypothetical protein
MKITLNRIKQIANNVLKREYETLSEDSIEAAMIDLIGNQKRILILDALGLDRSTWNHEITLKWEGSFRKNLKILSNEYLSPIAQKVLHDIFDNEEIVLNEREKAHLRKAYREKYLETAEEKICQLAEDAALKDADHLFEEYIQNLEVEEEK